MRQNQNAKRSRGRGRRSGNSGQHNINRNTTFDSNGPEGRLRGNAQQLFEKYTALAHDAQSTGERVLFEAHSQFADHYYRIHQSILANAEQRRQNDERAQNRKSDSQQADGGEQAKEASSDAASDNVSDTASDAAKDVASAEAPISDEADEAVASEAAEPVEAESGEAVAVAS